MRNSLVAVLFVIVLVIGLSVGWLGSMSVAPRNITLTQTTTLTSPVAPATAELVNLDVIPDWGGTGYDAFVIPSYANSTTPRPATNTTGPGPNDNNQAVGDAGDELLAGYSVLFEMGYAQLGQRLKHVEDYAFTLYMRPSGSAFCLET